MTNDAGKARSQENLLGPFFDEEGRELIFLVCCDKERVRVYVGPFQSEEAVKYDLRLPCHGAAHFRTARLPRDAHVTTSRDYLHAKERNYAHGWVNAWVRRQMDEE